MHELGVTFYVVRDVKKVAEENNVKKIDYDKETGEILTASSGLDIDEDKIREEESLDGYYMLLTSELEARPVYVWTKEHIEAHFLKPCIYWVWRVFYIHLAAKVRL